MFAERLNDRARTTLVEDGEHVAMFFLLGAAGRTSPRLFPFDEQRPVLARRAAALSEAVASTGAVAAAFISEAWVAPSGSVATGHDAGDSPEARDVLIVAAMDAEAYVAFETPVSRSPDGSIALGASTTRGPGDEAEVFRGAWAHWQAGKREQAGVPRRPRRALLDRLRRRS
jgi:hypothetical protein